MKIGMMNDPAKDIIEEFTFAGENKFDFVDLTIEPPNAQIVDIDIQKILALCKKHNIKIIGHTNFYMPWASPIKRLKDASMQEFTDHFIFFNKLGVKYVNLHANWYQPNSSNKEIISRIIESLKELVVIAKRYDLKLMLENQPNGPLSTPESLIPVFDKVDNLFFHLDVGHAQVAGRSENLTNKFIANFKDKLVHVHISDNKGNNDDHLPIGTGIIDWKDMLKQLKRVGYNNTITLEVFVKDRKYLLYSKKKILELWGLIS